MNSKLLTGALGLALAFAATGGVRAEVPAAPAQSQDQSAQPGTDASITTKVKAELMTRKDVPGTAISVSTMNGIVTLAGMVDNREQVQKSVAIARRIPGVRDVDATALNARND